MIVPTHIMPRAALKRRKHERRKVDFVGPNTHYAAGGIETTDIRQCDPDSTVPTHIMLRAALKLPRVDVRDLHRSPNTHYAACGFVQIGVGYKKTLHLPLGERNAFHMQLIKHRVLTQMRTNDRIEV